MDAKIWEYFGKYGLYFQSRPSYMSKDDSYSVLDKRTIKWSLRAQMHGAEYR